MAYLRYIRIASSAFMIFVCTIIFFDYYSIMPDALRDSVLCIQFVPSLLSFVKSPAFASAGFAAVILLTLFSGRLYCSFICPLGILQDIAIFFRRKKRYTFTAPGNIMRFTILAAVIISLPLTGTLVLLWLDPFSIYSRISGHLLSHAAVWMNNTISGSAEEMGFFLLHPVERIPAHGSVIFITSLMAGLILITALIRGRLYCNTICPVGAFLAVISRFSLFRISINRETCTACGACESICRSSCIDSNSGEVDFSRCVACLDCLSVCPVDSIRPERYGRPGNMQKTPPAREKNSTAKASMSRKKFITGLVALPAVRAVAGRLSGTETVFMKAADQVKYVRKISPVPPGGRNRDEFITSCTACSLCISMCPTGVLQPAVMQNGPAGIMQPYMDYQSGYCNYTCTLCGQVCPTDAIKKLTVEQKKITRIGKAVFIKENCITYTNGTVCGACSEHCPTKAVHMVPFRDSLVIPEVNPEICIGCGACEHVCPVRPFRAIYVDGINKHETAKTPDSSRQKTKQIKEEFPF